MDDFDDYEKLEKFKLDEVGKKKFKDRLIRLRKQNGWSQEELGYRLDVSRQTVSKWESTDTMPEMDKLIKISKLYSLTIDELVYGIKDEDKVKADISEPEEITKIEDTDEIIENNKQNLEILNVQKVHEPFRFNIKKQLPKIILLFTLMVFGAYILSCVNKFFILKSINDKFNSYKDINNCYYERKEIVTNDAGTMYMVTSKYWYKDGILKNEEKRTENGVTREGCTYIDYNKKEKYVLLENNKTGVKFENYVEDDTEKNILNVLIGENYYYSCFEIIKDSIVSSLSIEENNYIVERNVNDNKRNIYNKETGFIEQNYTINSQKEETKIISKIKLNVVNDKDMEINLDEYCIENIN